MRIIRQVRLSPKHKGRGKRVTSLKELRVAHGMTQTELADKLHISLRTYQRIEYGQQKPNVYVVILLQKIFQKDIEQMIKKK